MAMNVGALVTLVAAVHYFYMREFWVQIGMSPILYRYIDWSITVPLQMIEFYLILSAVQKDISVAMFWRLLVGTVFMLAAGYMGEAGFVNAWLGFIVGMCGWGFILYEIFMGERVCEAVVPDHAHHCQRRLVDLPIGLLLRVSDRRCRGQRPQPGVQLGGLREQDCVLPCHLGLGQEEHAGGR